MAKIKTYRFIDESIEKIKWPVAIATAVYTPFLVWASLQLAWKIILSPTSFITFSIGVALFVTVWRFYFRYSRIGTWMMRAEHEATHLLFAILTFHPFLGFSRKERAGMYIRFLGEGNWLIQISPYFFPTAAIFLWILAVIFVPLGTLFGVTQMALGFATGFHVVSTYREIRRDRAELEQLSWRFCWLFLPAANLLILGCLLGFSNSGLSGIFEFIQSSFRFNGTTSNIPNFPSWE